MKSTEPKQGLTQSKKARMCLFSLGLVVGLAVLSIHHAVHLDEAYRAVVAITTIYCGSQAVVDGVVAFRGGHHE
jgi:hypothetical protein